MEISHFPGRIAELVLIAVSGTEEQVQRQEETNSHFFAQRKSIRSRQQTALSRHKLRPVMSWGSSRLLKPAQHFVTWQHNWPLLPQGCSAEQALMGSSGRPGKTSSTSEQITLLENTEGQQSTPGVEGVSCFLSFPFPSQGWPLYCCHLFPFKKNRVSTVTSSSCKKNSSSFLPSYLLSLFTPTISPMPVSFWSYKLETDQSFGTLQWNSCHAPFLCYSCPSEVDLSWRLFSTVISFFMHLQTNSIVVNTRKLKFHMYLPLAAI